MDCVVDLLLVAVGSKQRSYGFLTVVVVLLASDEHTKIVQEADLFVNNLFLGAFGGFGADELVGIVLVVLGFHYATSLRLLKMNSQASLLEANV
jgi:hypothetical protein